MALRNARRTRLVMFDEDAGHQGEDPASPAGYVVPLQAATSVSLARPYTPVPIFRGDRDPYGFVLGDITAQGSMPVDLDTIWSGRALHSLLGISPTPVATAEGYLHPFVHDPNAEPGSVQIQKEILESSEFFRGPGYVLSKFAMAFQASGAAMAAIDMLGMGLKASTALSGTPSKDVFSPMSFQDGFVKLGSDVLGNVGKGSFAFDNAPTRESVCFNGGVAGGVFTDVLALGGDLEMLYKDRTFFDEAANATALLLEFFFADKPLDTATAWLRVRIAQAFFEMQEPNVGGKGAVRQSQKFVVPQNSAAAYPAEIFSAKGPFTIPASSHLGIKVNGGATVDKTITAGSRTAAQIAADIGTVTGLLAADTWPKNGAVPIGPRLKLETSGVGADKSIQIDTALSGDCSAALGLDGVARTGHDATAHVTELFNSKSTSYDGT